MWDAGCRPCVSVGWRYDVERAANEIAADVGLEIGELQDEIEPLGEDLASTAI